jgi:hypothetical protein
VREFDHFGDCFCTCALIIWTVLLQGQSLVTPKRLVFDDPSGIDVPMVGEEGCFGPIHTDPSTPPGDTHQTVDDDVSFKRRLSNFTKAVVCKRDSPLIRGPPNQSPAKPVLPWRRRRLAA